MSRRMEASSSSHERGSDKRPASSKTLASPSPLEKVLDEKPSPIVSEMITLLLAAPGLISKEMGDKCHKELLDRGFLQPAGHGGRFTWDGYENAITKSPLWPNSHTWIDYVLFVRGSSVPPIYMDNRAIRLGSDVAFPELSVSYMKRCGEMAVKLRREARRRLGLSSDVLAPPCDSSEGSGDKTCRKHYDKLLKRIKESLNASDLSDEDLFGKELFNLLTHSWASNHNYYGPQMLGDKEDDILKVLDPMLAPFLTEASDHYAVLSNITFAEGSLHGQERGFKRGSPSMAESPSYKVKNTRSVDSKLSSSLLELGILAGEETVDVYEPSFNWRDVSKGNWKVSPPRVESSAKTIRILSQNLHFRPYIMSRISEYCGSNRQDGLYEIPKLVANNMQELRARVFVNALLQMKDDEFPHVICLQETQNDGANKILTQELIKSGRFPSHITSLEAKQTAGRGDEAYIQDVLWSGLQLWTSWQIEDSHFARFSDDIVTQVTDVYKKGILSKVTRTASAFIAPVVSQAFATVKNPQRTLSQAGEAFMHPRAAFWSVRSGAARAVDRFVGTHFSGPAPTHKTPAPATSSGTDAFALNKGMLWVLLKESDFPGARRMQIIIIHPSPYVPLPFGALGSSVEDVPATHRAQINMVREFVKTLSEDTRLAGVPLFITGDLNINKYAARPDSEEETDVNRASQGRSKEFDEVIRKLRIQEPHFVADENTDRWVPKNRLRTAMYIEKFLARNARPDDMVAHKTHARESAQSARSARTHSTRSSARLTAARRAEAEEAARRADAEFEAARRAEFEAARRAEFEAARKPPNSVILRSGPSMHEQKRREEEYRETIERSREMIRSLPAGVLHKLINPGAR